MSLGAPPYESLRYRCSVGRKGFRVVPREGKDIDIRQVKSIKKSTVLLRKWYINVVTNLINIRLMSLGFVDLYEFLSETNILYLTHFGFSS